MDPFPFNTGTTANVQTRLPTSDKSTNDSAQRVNSHLPLQPTQDSFPKNTSYSLSPPHEAATPHIGHAGEDPSRYNDLHQGLSHAASNPTRLNPPPTPPTPPRQSDEYDLLRRWHMEQFAQERRPHDTAPHFGAPTIRAGASIVPHRHGDTVTLPRFSQLLGQWNKHAVSQLMPQPTPSSAHHPPVQRAPSHQWPIQADGVDFNQGQMGLPQHPQYAMRSHEPSMQSVPVNAYARMLPLPPQLQSNAAHSPYQPPTHIASLQQWPAYHQNNQPPPHQLPSQPKSPEEDPAPGYRGRQTIDEKTQRKQEAFQRKAEQRRHQRQSMATSNPPQPRIHKPSTMGGVKRKLSNRIIDPTTPTKPPPLRPPQVPGYHPLPQGYQLYVPPSYAAVYGPGPFGPPLARSLTPSPPPPPIDYDSLPQAIIQDYEGYHWSVTLYEVELKDQYDFAQGWLEYLLKINLANREHRWHTHSTQGFIPAGTRFSFLALHNAVDPFEWGPAAESTTTVGLYGAYWYEHEEIHWKTISPSIEWLLNWCLEQGSISITKNWRCDEPKASEKRFHRAYWLAANMRDLKGLLNHGTSNDVPHDAVEKDFDWDFEVTEEDLTWGGWAADEGEGEGSFGEDESKAAWEKILQANEENGETCGFQHVVTGSSEWV